MSMTLSATRAVVERSSGVAALVLGGLLLGGCLDSGSSGGDGASGQEDAVLDSGPEEEQQTLSDDDRVDVLVNQDDRIIYERVDITDRTDERSIHDQDPLQVFPGEDEGFLFEWEVETGGFVTGEEMLYLRFDESNSAAALAISANKSQSTLRSEANCTYGNESELRCFRAGDIDSFPFETTTSLTDHINALPATATVESELCSVVQGCKRVRIGRIQFN